MVVLQEFATIWSWVLYQRVSMKISKTKTCNLVHGNLRETPNATHPPKEIRPLFLGAGSLRFPWLVSMATGSHQVTFAAPLAGAKKKHPSEGLGKLHVSACVKTLRKVGKKKHHAATRWVQKTNYKWSYGAPRSMVISPQLQNYKAIYRGYTVTPFITSKGPTVYGLWEIHRVLG